MIVLLLSFSFNVTLYLLSNSPYGLNNSTFHENVSFLSLIHILFLYIVIPDHKHTYTSTFIFIVLLESPASILKSIILQLKDIYYPNLAPEGNKFFASAYDDI